LSIAWLPVPSLFLLCLYQPIELLKSSIKWCKNDIDQYCNPEWGSSIAWYDHVLGINNYWINKKLFRFGFCLIFTLSPYIYYVCCLMIFLSLENHLVATIMVWYHRSKCFNGFLGNWEVLVIYKSELIIIINFNLKSFQFNGFGLWNKKQKGVAAIFFLPRYDSEINSNNQFISIYLHKSDLGLWNSHL
jgi:hypothetical protein